MICLTLTSTTLLTLAGIIKTTEPPEKFGGFFFSQLEARLVA